jgi:hypothetical protein
MLLQLLFTECVGLGRWKHGARLTRLLTNARIVLNVDKAFLAAVVGEAGISQMRASLARRWVASLVSRSVDNLSSALVGSVVAISQNSLNSKTADLQ